MAKMTKCSPEIPNILRVYRPPANVSIKRVGLRVRDAIFLTLWLSLSFTTSACVPKHDEVTPKSKDAYQVLTGSDAEDYKETWDTLFKRRNFVYGKDPAAFLKEQIGTIPVGRALDLAAGEGRNAVFLAKKGFQVDAVDLSEVALKKAKRLARENQVDLKTIVADLNQYSIPPETYDLIVDVDFLLRGLIPEIKRGLKRGGYVIFENFTVAQLKNAGGESLKRAYLFESGELKELFKDFRIVLYRETNDGKEARAQLVAQKR